MTIKINASLNGVEIQEIFAKQLEENKISPDLNNIKFMVLNSKNQEVEVGADKVRVVYNKE